MKHQIKSIFLTLFCSFFILSLSSNANAQKIKNRPLKKRVVKHHVVKHQISMAQAHKVMKKTNMAIIAANKSVKLHKVYSGDLAKAIHHQRFAKKLLAMHKPHRALQHSRLARKYAFVSIKKNKGRVDNNWNVNKEEETILGKNIPDADLEKELSTSMPNLKNDDKSITDKDMTDIEVLETNPNDYKSE